jgi:hypothetical protein
LPIDLDNEQAVHVLQMSIDDRLRGQPLILAAFARLCHAIDVERHRQPNTALLVEVARLRGQLKAKGG